MERFVNISEGQYVGITRLLVRAEQWSPLQSKEARGPLQNCVFSRLTRCPILNGTKKNGTVPFQMAHRVSLLTP